MQRGNLVIYDNYGKVWYQSGEADGDVLPHVYPSCLPYIEIPFGMMVTKKLISIDLSGETPIPVFEDVPQQPTYQELQDMIDMMAGGII